MLFKWAPNFSVPYDDAYYGSRYPGVPSDAAKGYFYRRGWREGHSPAPYFDMMAYLSGEAMAVVKRRENLNDRPFIRSMVHNIKVPDQARNLAQSYIEIVDSGLFDRAFYLENYSDVVGDPIEHYLHSGWKSGYNPGPRFSTLAYLNRYPDVAEAEYNPLLHFIRFGQIEARIASAVPLTAGENIPTQAEPHCPPIEDYRRALHAQIRQRLGPTNRRAFIAGPEISILVPVYNVPPVWLRQMIESVQNQTYDRWQLCIVDDCSTSEELHDLLSEIPSWDSRIHVAKRAQNGGISAASNDCLALATGEYIALLDNDDMITNDALEEMAKAILANDGPDWLYSDEFKIDEDNNVSDLFAKPDWSPSMLLNYMYTGHLTLYKKQVVEAVGGFRSEYDFSQDYDLALRLSERDLRIVHVEKYLYAWRMIATSSAAGGKPTARISNIAALQDAVDRRGWNGVSVPLSTANRVERKIADNIKVSIIIPSDNEFNISASINSIKNKTNYDGYEIIVVTNSGIAKNLASVFDDENIIWKIYDKPFNFSDKCNEGAAASGGDFFVFFNDDVRVISHDWIQALLEYLTLPGVGMVGPKLLYENGLIQHGGMGTGMRRLVGTTFHCYPDNSPVHFNFAQCVRDVSILCGALIGMPAKLFNEIGGFDAVNAPIGHSDVDLCFRVREAGYRCVYTPYAKLVHIGHVSIGEEEAVKKAFKRDKSEVFLLKRWGEYVAHDPYFTPSMRGLTFIDSPEKFELFPGSSSGDRGDVLILSHDLTSSGAPKVAYDLALLMQSKGYFVTVASPEDGPYRAKLVSHGITVIVDELILTGHESSMVLARSFDLVIANTIVCWATVKELAKTTPTYLYTHETELVHHFANIYPNFLDALRSATQIWSGSQHAADALGRYGLTPHIVEYGVDDITAVENNPAIRIGLFGSIEPRKGHDLAILGMGDIAPKIREKARLDLYGRTLSVGYREQIEGIALGIKQVHFRGELAYDEYRKALSDTDIVLVCSRDDTLPLVSLDALALGKALVCSATTGTSLYLQHEKSALILEHNSPQEIADALTKLINDAALRHKIGQGGRAAFEKYFTYDAFAKRVFDRLDNGGLMTIAS
ncbi:glycosyltransferase [Sphingobium yanoikuyae]|uniref:glycosyltransferase n=1 Tax=Sphingobium yanoikuyae TaxID=13690 RepID=UPI0028AD5394|nr:glycosyltransferase [Sphingobium yanoikuyae]